MDGASRHAHRLANNFLEDLETMQRASRARDRRAMSHFETRVEEPVSSVTYSSTKHRRTPLRTVRMSSVAPMSSSVYQPTATYETEFSTLPPIPRTISRTSRYRTESPYYLTTHFGRSVEPSRPIFSTHYSAAPSPLTQRYTYYYPSPVTSRVYTSPPRATSYSSLSSEVLNERRRIERRLDNLLDYKLPPPEYYHDMRKSLRGIHDRLDQHRRLIDRYTGIDVNAAPVTVGDRIESKYAQLASRMGRYGTVTDRA